MRENLARIHTIADELFSYKTEVKLQSNLTAFMAKIYSSYSSSEKTV